MSGFLKEPELEHLTGFSQTEKQSGWLSDNRILHYINAKHKVVVTWDAVNNPRYMKSEEPDFGKVS